MSRWNSHRQEEQELIDFDTLLTANSSALQLLAHPKIVEQAKSKSTKFTQRIVHPKHRLLLNELIDIALTPRVFMQEKQVTLERSATHSAIEILSSLSEEFIEEIFDSHNEEEDAVVQGEREYPILGQLLRVLSQGQAEETALAYLNKLITPFIYQRSEQMVRLAPTLLLPALLNHFGNNSVAEIFTKLLQAQNEKDFFEGEKVNLIAQLCRNLAQEKDQKRSAANAESLAGLMQSLVEKHQDKYEKVKYARLIKAVLERSHLFLFIFDLFDKSSHSTNARIHLLRAIQTFLRIHLPNKQQSKISEEELHSDGSPLHACFGEGLKLWLGSHLTHQFVSDSRLQLLTYYKLLKTALIVEPSLVETVLTHSFLVETLKFMRQDTNNNILHNYQRQVLVTGIRQSPRVCQSMQDELGFIEFFKQGVTERNSRSCFDNQIFLIAEALREHSLKSQILTPTWSQLSGIISLKRQFYSAIIGGNPRGQEKWDSLENDNDMILCSLNQKDFEGGEKQRVQGVEVQKAPNQKIMIQYSSGLEDLGGTEVLSEEEDDPFNPTPSSDPKNKHFFDFELPLDSDKEQSDQNRSSSLDDIPIVIKIQSIQQPLRASNGLRGSNTSGQTIRVSDQQLSNLQVVVEDPFIEQTTQIVIEESFKDESPLQIKTIYQYSKEEVSTLLYSKYGLTLAAPVVVSLKEEIQRNLAARYGLTLKTRNVSSIIHARQEIQTLLLGKYGVALKGE